jgi:hypothetical protein
MTLSKYITNQLYQLFKDERDVAGTLERDSGGCYRWHLSHEGQDISLTFGECDRHSTELHEMQIVSLLTSAGEPEQPGLATLAERAIASLNYLEEPLAVWELEEHEHTVQLRSLPPRRDGEAVSYWELVIQPAQIAAGTEITTRISRYHWEPGMIERETLRYPATFATLGRMAESLATYHGAGESREPGN